MDWDPANGGPQSPKKKLHTKAKGESLAETVRHVRMDLKTAKDISARNLMLHMNGDESSTDGSDGSSTIEEVMVIEEEATDYVSETEDNDDDEEIVEEIIEEIIEDSDDDSDFEPLPPPISIPVSLQVQDDEDNEDDNDDDCVNELPEKKENPCADRTLRPSKVRGPSCYGDDPTQVQAKKEEVVRTSNNRVEKSRSNDESAPPTTPKQKKKSSVPKTPTKDSAGKKTPKTPSKKSVKKESTPKTPTKAPEQPKAAVVSTVTPTPPPEPRFNKIPDEDDDEDRPEHLKWQKPDWTKNTKLRKTGKEATDNLARPITSLPHTKGDNNSVTTTPTRTTINKIKLPSPSKSAPTIRKDLLSGDDLPKIEWQKPDWTKKPVLRTTSKGAKLKQGGEIARPIGGIRPVKDEE